ncbi:hypothetical protein [Thermocatellispora tengchongensis]|uniref:hypothetical protein n=1 Tax=Thermocatellispora tengchongensis TaxID=1073253 RepID=UPI003633D262
MGVRVVVHEGSRRSLVRRLLPVALAFAAVIAGLALLAPHLRDALGTAPGSPRSGAATHPCTTPARSRAGARCPPTARPT